jgi:GR25 family glycosyltransferase involved in LPS biosynthesis
MSITCLEDIKHIFYINLEHRVDRRQHVESELTKIGLQCFTRFNAIKMENGALGCSMSHLKCLQMAKENGWPHVLIVEDDILFLDKDVFIKQINNFFKNHINDWDTLLISGNNIPPYERLDDTCVKVTTCQTTTGYLVKSHYYDKLIQNIKMGIVYLTRRPQQDHLYAIDKFWFTLQRADNWLLLTPLTVVQREDYSDIQKRKTNFIKGMIDLDKTNLIKNLIIF